MATQITVVAGRPTRARGGGLWSDAWGRLRKNRLAVLGLIMVIALLLVGIFGPLIAPYPYNAQDLKAVFAGGGGPLPPFSPGHVLGTDQLGRDLLSRLLDGARISVTVALVVQAVILAIGVPIGALAGWFGGRLDNLLMASRTSSTRSPTCCSSSCCRSSSARPSSGGRSMACCSCSWPSV